MLDTYAINNALTATELDGGMRYTHANGNTLEIVGEYDSGEAWLTRNGVEQHCYYEHEDGITTLTNSSDNSVTHEATCESDIEQLLA